MRARARGGPHVYFSRSASEPRECLQWQSAERQGFADPHRSGRRFSQPGRSPLVGRRRYDIGIQQPEPVTEVHRIPTDDPAGIEDYWHRRFADRRKGGEWFALTRTDVMAFKRRRFM